MRELRLTARLLLNRPAFTATAVATIALAIAGNTLMFAALAGIAGTARRAVLVDPVVALRAE
jgi:hypothetical protein